MSNQQGDFIWYELLTTDLTGAIAFYGAVLDWQVTDSGLTDTAYMIASSGATPVAGLMTMPQEAIDAGALPIWCGYVAVDNVDDMVTRVVAEGGAVQMPATDIPHVGRLAMVADPDGIPFYVMRGSSDSASEAFSLDTVGRCGWNELNAKNLSGAERFYSKLFGWTMGFEMQMGEMGVYRFFEQAGDAIGGMMQASALTGPALWSFYFRVADIDTAAQKVTAAGGTILHGPAEVPGKDFIITGIDPQGVLFSLVGARVG